MYIYLGLPSIITQIVSIAGSTISIYIYTYLGIYSCMLIFIVCTVGSTISMYTYTYLGI